MPDYCMYTYVCVCMYVCMYVCVHVCMYVYVYLFTRLQTESYTCFSTVMSTLVIWKAAPRTPKVGILRWNTEQELGNY